MLQRLLMETIATIYVCIKMIKVNDTHRHILVLFVRVCTDSVNISMTGRQHTVAFEARKAVWLERRSKYEQYYRKI